MKRIIHFLNFGIFALIAVPLILAGNACKPEEPYVITCSDGILADQDMPKASFELQNVDDVPGKLPRDLSLVIQYQLQYDHYLKPIGYLPKIDFERKTLLIVRTNSRVAFKVGRKISIDCKQKLITWRQDALPEGSSPSYPDPRTNIFTVLVPKVTDDIRFVFEENIIK